MSVNVILVNSYATYIYLQGKNTLTNIGLTRPEYVEPIKERAAKAYYIENIDNALTRGWITSQEHADTLALKTPDDPQHMPEIKFVAPEQ